MSNTTYVEIKNEVTVITSLIEINTSLDTVWDVLKFPGKVELFHPLIKKSFMTTRNQNRVGAKRHCDLLPIGQMEEIITEWNERESFTIEVTDGKMLPPYHFMKGRFELQEVEQRTRVKFSFSYKLKFRILGRLLDNLLIRSQFKKAPSKYLEGLKNYIENNH